LGEVTATTGGNIVRRLTTRVFKITLEASDDFPSDNFIRFKKGEWEGEEGGGRDAPVSRMIAAATGAKEGWEVPKVARNSTS
jgi:hypothetical protein